MPLHPDLLTDEDFRQEPRQEEPKGYFNQFVRTAAMSKDNDLCCSNCDKVLAEKQGDIFFSCCPATFPTKEAAQSAVNEDDAITGVHIADYMGTFEL